MITSQTTRRLICLYLQARQVRNLHRSAARAGAGGIFVVSYSFFAKVNICSDEMYYCKN